MDINQILEHNTFKLKDDLKRELMIELGKQADLFHLKTLTQIFIENRIYKKIEKCKTSEAIKKAVRDGLEPYLKDMLPPAAKFPKLLSDEIRIDIRDVADEDIDKLLQIPIRRISQFDIDKNEDSSTTKRITPQEQKKLMQK